jgi:hypothetical protein
MLFSARAKARYIFAFDKISKTLLEQSGFKILGYYYTNSFSSYFA